MSKVGYMERRRAFYMPALTAISCNEVVKAQWERLLSRYKGGKISICAAIPFDAKIALAS
ncbi:MAG: hypothetical protein AAHH96_00400 [Candidatus Symbiodolus clandestinus]